MSDQETKYTVDFRVLNLPLTEEEKAAYIKAWYDLADADYQYFSTKTREKMRLLNAAFIHWHTLAEDAERKYAKQKGFGE